MTLILVGRDDNDLCTVLRDNDVDFTRVDRPEDASSRAKRGDGVLILADGYPDARTAVDPAVYRMARSRGVRMYVEFPAAAPGVDLGDVRTPEWERAVVATHAFAPRLKRLRILMVHKCSFVEVREADAGPTATGLHLVLARVAGFDTAVYGLPEETLPLLFEHPSQDVLMATTKLSHFVTGRYAPAEAWASVWRWILTWLTKGEIVQRLRLTPTVRPTYTAASSLPDDVEQQAFRRGVRWYRQARLLIHPRWQEEARHRLHSYHDGTGPGPQGDWPVGDGRHGMIEGAGSYIYPDGTQDWRYFVRADCVGEASMAHAFGWALTEDGEARTIATNLNDFIYRGSIFAQGPRADPQSPSYGLLSWDTKPPGDGIYYGDDNARSMLGTLAAAALLKTDRWDRDLLRCLLANLRTTGPSGFRVSRIREAELQARGWRHYWERDYILYAPHYESWLWACFLWAYRQTGFTPFLERTVKAIRMTMAAYPEKWHWTNGIQQERARMLLPLAWLVRLDDTPTHRTWLRRIADELLAHQDTSGAIREEIGSPGHGAYGPPASNAAYGTSEAPLIQQNGDPLCDLLYTTNFALVGLHEAAVATGAARYAEAVDSLTRFLCRIQVSSQIHPELDGGWYRAFDFRRWAYWASNADVGWGAWSIESGWTQGWITAVLGLRQTGTSLWELTSRSRIGDHTASLVPVMLPSAAVT